MIDLDEAALEAAIIAYCEDPPKIDEIDAPLKAAIRAYLAALPRIDEADLDVVIYDALPDYVLSMPRAMIIRKAVMAYLVALLIPLAGAQAHNAPTGWAYDPKCCGGMDCRPLNDSDVKETRTGWLTPGGPISYNDKRVMQSKDERYHICSNFSMLRCFYVPPRSY